MPDIPLVGELSCAGSTDYSAIDCRHDSAALTGRLVFVLSAVISQLIANAPISKHGRNTLFVKKVLVMHQKIA